MFYKFLQVVVCRPTGEIAGLSCLEVKTRLTTNQSILSNNLLSTVFDVFID